jgi:ubiquinone/menaquinone biosynthesis C-methylase UbiE
VTTSSTSRSDLALDRWWTFASPVYDRSVSLVGWHRWQDALLADVVEGSVLDLGCGPAHLARALLRRGVGYVGLDRNPAMVARAHRAIDAWGPGRGLVVRADVTALPFDASSFDVVVTTGVLGLLTVAARRVALREISRVSRGQVRLLEPIVRADEPLRLARSRIVALVRERPLAVSELVEAGLDPEVRGPPVLLGVYSMVRASAVIAGSVERSICGRVNEGAPEGRKRR